MLCPQRSRRIDQQLNKGVQPTQCPRQVPWFSLSGVENRADRVSDLSPGRCQSDLNRSLSPEHNPRGETPDVDHLPAVLTSERKYARLGTVCQAECRGASTPSHPGSLLLFFPVEPEARLGRRAPGRSQDTARSAYSRPLRHLRCDRTCRIVLWPCFATQFVIGC